MQRVLKNRYWALRHGFSKANEKGIVVSYHQNGVLPRYSLAPRGILQAQAAGQLIANSLRPESIVIFSSDFSRTRETAHHVQMAVEKALAADGNALSTRPVYLQPDLRERKFGEFELGSHENYKRVWEIDALDSSHTKFGVESVKHVVCRAENCIQLAERHFSDMNIVLVSHGDILQITQTVFQNVDCSMHRSLPHLETCEFRPLN